MLRVTTLLVLLLLGTALAYGASVHLLRPTPTRAVSLGSGPQPQPDLLVRSWVTIKAMFR